MFALVDGNNFYASCEQVFQPQLRKTPLVVLSNNDGCAIARCAMAKALGIRMGQPAHELKDYISRFGLKMRSANFTLYGDMSNRVVSILRTFTPRLEVYSIDESFLDLSGVSNRLDLAQDIRYTVNQWTGIPCCVGIGPTKTLAKMANKWAKKHGGVIDASDRGLRAEIMAQFPVEDLWGVGRKWAAKLEDMGIHTALSLVEAEPDRKQIIVSRSFGQRVEDPRLIGEAAATFATRACEKLRKRGLVASGVWVFAQTDGFRLDLPQHYPSRAVTLPQATGDTRLVLEAVRGLLRGMLRKVINCIDSK